MQGQICFVVGARPNFMKAAPVIAALRARGVDVLLVHTGQHYDSEMSDVFLTQLGLPAPDVFLGVGSGTHGEQTAKALVGVEAVLLEHEPELVVVPGDVNSTLAAALAAVKLHIPVAHLEAGLRSFDTAMPEEHNRRLTDHVSSLLLTHSPGALDNLEREGIDASRVHLVGNTMIDSVFAHLDAAKERTPWAAAHHLKEGEYGLVTLHRPALVDDPDLLRRTIERLSELAAIAPILFAAHPRTIARLEQGGVDTSALTVTGPLAYLDFLGLEAGAAFVVTDSGGVQEETSALGVRCFTLRETTERPITIELGTNVLLGLDPDRIADVPDLLAEPLRAEPIPLWDGRAGDRAAAAIVEFLSAAPVGAAT